MLQKGVADYELAQTFPAGSPERTKSLKEALAQFESLYKSYRTQLAGLAAQMYQAKCYEEQRRRRRGHRDLQAAHGARRPPAARAAAQRRLLLHRRPGQAQAIRPGGRRGLALAGDLQSARRAAISGRAGGLDRAGQEHRRPDARGLRPPSGPRPSAESSTPPARSCAIASPFKKEAMALLKKYKPSAAVRAEEIARLTYEDLIGQGRRRDRLARVGTRHRPARRRPSRKADPAKNPDKANLARYNLAFCYYMNKQYYEAAVLAEHYARRYPQGGLGAKATEIGMQAWADAYSTYTEIDRASDLNHLIDLANYTAETWPDKEQGDGARMNLGQIYLGMGQYDKAIEILASVRQRSRDWVDRAEPAGQCALGEEPRPGTAGRRRGGPGRSPEGDRRLERRAQGPPRSRRRADRSRLGRQRRRPGDRAHRDRQARRGPGLARSDRQGPDRQIGPGLRAADRSSAQGLYHLGQGRAGDRLDEGPRAVRRRERARPALLQARQAAGKGARIAQAKRGTRRPSPRMHQAYKTFLTTLAESKTGQSYDSLQWAGEGLLTLDAYQDAEKVLRRVLTEFTADPQFLQQPGGRGKLLRTRLRLVTALRGQGKFDEANSILDELLTQKPPYHRDAVREGHAAGSGSRGRSRQLVGGPPPLGRPRQEDGADPPAAGVLTTTPGITWPGSSTSRKTRRRRNRRSWA